MGLGQRACGREQGRYSRASVVSSSLSIATEVELAAVGQEAAAEEAEVAAELAEVAVTEVAVTEEEEAR